MVTRYDPEIRYEGLGYTSKSVMVEFNNGAYGTHADYKALEDERDKFKALWDQTEACLQSCLEENMSIRAELAECRKALSAIGGVAIGSPLDGTADWMRNTANKALARGKA